SAKFERKSEPQIEKIIIPDTFSPLRSFSQTASSEEDNEEWRPSEPKTKTRKAARDPTAKQLKPLKRTAKRSEPKEVTEQDDPRDPKPTVSLHPAAEEKSKTAKDFKNTGESGLPGTETKQNNQGKKKRAVGANTKKRQTKCPEEQPATTSGPSDGKAQQTNKCSNEGSSYSGLILKKEEQIEEDDYTFEEPCPKKQKTSRFCLGQPAALPSAEAQNLRNELNMNWNLIELLSNLTCTERWVCVNIIMLLREDNTVPFMVRYRKEMINHMDADAVRDVQLVYQELCSLAKKTQSVIQTLKKDGVLTTELEQSLRSCRSVDELDHVYSPYKKGSKLTKARRAKALGLEVAASALMETPHTLDLKQWVKPGVEGLSSVEKVATGVEHILADMIAKDPETLTRVKTLCESSVVTIHSSVSKAAQEKGVSKDHTKTGAQAKNKDKDIDKFQLYFDFTCNVQRIQPHQEQTLAINRGESLKILTVKVNIPDRVKSDFSSWCINSRWRPKIIPKAEHQLIIKNAVEDSYKRLVLPFLTRSYRTKLTAAAEKESIAMFVRNLRQRLLVGPVRGSVIMGVDPGYKHGCKVAILSPTSQILHTDIVYLHHSSQQSQADKLRHLIVKYSCTRIVIGNGTACRETEAYFSQLISRRLFHPLDVSYCITNEAGASIYSVSPEAVKEMPELDPNLRSAAVSIARRVQDPLAELVKIDPKHIGIGTYQHDVSSSALKAALDGVVQECVSFVGVDINMCSETLMRHVAGLNAGRARSIAEWREQNGPFINREQLKLVKGMGPKTYQQCAGFIRINPQTRCANPWKQSCQFYGGSANSSLPQVPENPAAKKGKGKACVKVSTSFNPLDQTCIHPESYHVVQRFLSIVGGRADPIGSPRLRQRVEDKVRSSSVEELARTADTSPETLKLIIDGLTQPPGFDIRQNFGQADFKQGIVSMSDLRVGAVLTGRVDNTALFGAFVDIGVGRSGLIHKSNITPDKLPISQRRRSLALGPGERVEVRVLNVDHQRGRIGLDLIRVL
uniref:S1 RNA binding domain 1 n=1 Tax=Tetraodon nigroviridis TaxID=99883 RepID=H3CPT9_TETNG